MPYGFSPEVVRVPDEGPRRRHTTGYWILPPAAGWTPPADPAAFVATDGRPVVSIGFGSMVGSDPGPTRRAGAGCRARRRRARRAGVPVTAVLFTMDQSFWGARVAELGVGPDPIPRRRLTRERLAAALCTSVTDAGIRARAAALGERLRAEDGVGEAVRRCGEVDVRRSRRP